MVETSTLTPHQELVNKLGTGHPQKQLLMVLERIEKVEEIISLPQTEEKSQPEEVKAEEGQTIYPLRRGRGRPKKNV